MPLRFKVNILEALKQAGYNTTRIRQEALLSQSTLQKLRTDGQLSWSNIETICRLLNCQPGDILEYIPDPPRRINPCGNFFMPYLRQQALAHPAAPCPAYPWRRAGQRGTAADRNGKNIRQPRRFAGSFHRLLRPGRIEQGTKGCGHPAGSRPLARCRLKKCGRIDACIHLRWV